MPPERLLDDPSLPHEERRTRAIVAATGAWCALASTLNRLAELAIADLERDREKRR